MSIDKNSVLRVVVIATLLFPCIGVSLGLASDWPSWRGRTQNGVSDETNLPLDWSKAGKNLIWSDAWIGRSTPAVFNGRVCANGRSGDDVSKKETVACWDAENGSKLWEHTFNIINTTVPFNRVGWSSVTGDTETGYLFAINVDGYLNAYDQDGTIVWSWRLAEELGRASGYGGRTSTPIIDEDLLILSVIGSLWGDYTGPPRHRYIAFDKRTGETQWISTPGGNVFDMNTQSVPIIAVVNGQRLLIDGNADGHIYALQARTGKKIWEFNLSKRGINVSPILSDNTVYISHSEENLDEATMGRVVAIDATGTGDVTTTHEVWRINELAVGFSSPTVKDGHLYVIDNSANLHAIDTNNGQVLWQHSIGNVGKSSPVWADGKLYVTEVNGNVHILELDLNGVKVLDTETLEVNNGRPAEIYGSFAPAYGRLYFTAESGIYCIGNSNTLFTTDTTPGPIFSDEKTLGEMVHLQLVPAEVIISAGQTVEFRLHAFDANGRYLDTQDETWSTSGLVDSTISTEGVLKTTVATDNQAGKVIAAVGNLEASAQVRVFTPLPWTENFENGRPAFWIGGGPSLGITDIDDQQVLRKRPSPSGLHRHSTYMGPSTMSSYTVQVDVMSSKWNRRRPDIGIINSGYTLDLKGNAQRVQIHSWAAELRVEQRVDFIWEPELWYTLKLRVDIESDRAIVQGKIWKRDNAEPVDWTITLYDPEPVNQGSPGLIGYSPIDIYFDNVRIIENQ